MDFLKLWKALHNGERCFKMCEVSLPFLKIDKNQILIPKRLIENMP